MKNYILLFLLAGFLSGCMFLRTGESGMQNSILRLSGVEASPVECPRIDDINGKAAWQGFSGENNYVISSLLSTYKTTSADAVPAGLQGDVYWYDTGLTENGESVYYDTSGTYAYWNNGTDWLISAVADVGGTPTNYFIYQEYPLTITGEGSGSSRANGIFTTEDGVLWSGQSIPTDSYVFTGSRWEFREGFLAYFINTSTDTLPPKTEWVKNGIFGTLPAPTLSYTDPAENVFWGYGDWSGIITISEDASREVWSLTRSVVQFVDDSGTWPPSDFGDGITTELGQVITLDLQGGTGQSSVNVYDGTYGTLPTITRYAYIFAGWFTGRGGSGIRVYDDDSLVVSNDDDMLYVKWISSISGEVSSGQSMLSHFAVSVGTDLFAAPLSARKTRAESLKPVLPIPPAT